MGRGKKDSSNIRSRKPRSILNNLKQEADRAEREGNLGLVAEIQIWTVTCSSARSWMNSVTEPDRI